MSTSNAWAEFAAVFRSTRDAFLEHEKARTELKALMPEDAREAIGHGLRAKRSKSGAISFDLLATLQRRWQRRRWSSPIRKNHLLRPSGPPSLRVCPKTSGGITKFSEHEAD